jgi:hypothetical protein
LDRLTWTAEAKGIAFWSALRIRDLELRAMSLGGSLNPLACRN